jgi:hypothetical protein
VRRLLVLCAVLALGACAPSPAPLPADVRSSIRSVRVNREVASPRRAVDWACLEVPNRGIQCIGGSESLRVQTGPEFVARIAERFSAQLKRAGNSPSVVDEEADATITLWARVIQIVVTPGMCGVLGTCYGPQLTVQGTMRNASGTVVWEQSSTVNAFAIGSRIPKRALAAYTNTPELIRQDFTVAADQAVDELIRALAPGN